MPGQEGAGVVEAIGPGVTEVEVGDRVAYAGVPGAYAEVRIAPAARLVKLPPGIDDQTAAAMMLKGMTAEFLLLRCARVGRGDTILFHAAAGGVGSIACQWARHLGIARHRHGGRSGEGRASRRAHGCDTSSTTTSEDIVARVKELTGGAGVRAVFDWVGKRDVRRVARLPGHAGHAGAVRPVLGRGAARSSRRPAGGARRCFSPGRPSGTTSATRDELLASAGALFEAWRAAP